VVADSLLFKEDWADARPRLEAWWHGDVIDRVALAITAPRETPVDGFPAPPSEPDDTLRFWTDLDWRLTRAEAALARTHYLGEAFPYFAPLFGPGSMALYLGSEPTLDRETVWSNPTLSSLATPPELRFDPDNRWWKLNRDFALAGVERGRGKYLVTHPDIIENLDVLASLRGTEPLLVDLLEHAESVHAGLAQVNELYFRYFDDLYHPISAATPGGGCASLFRVWGPGKVAKVQCDFSAMISPGMFAEFVVPQLREQCRRLDQSIYHWDGPGQIAHFEHLLDIPELSGIQWIPGTGLAGSAAPEWLPFYKRMQERGKRVVLQYWLAPQQIEPLLRELSPKGVLMTTSCDSEEEARDLLRKVERWSAKRA
jgi:hypothetical protein